MEILETLFLTLTFFLSFFFWIPFMIFVNKIFGVPTEAKLDPEEKESVEETIKLSELERKVFGKELYALKFCNKVLNERIEKNSRRNWDWEIKRKIAIFCIQILQNKLAKAEISDLELSIKDKQSILKEHSLLQPQQAPVNTNRYRVDIKKKVAQHIQKIYSNLQKSN